MDLPIDPPPANDAYVANGEDGEEASGLQFGLRAQSLLAGATQMTSEKLDSIRARATRGLAAATHLMSLDTVQDDDPDVNEDSEASLREARAVEARAAKARELRSQLMAATTEASALRSAVDKATVERKAATADAERASAEAKRWAARTREAEANAEAARRETAAALEAKRKAESALAALERSAVALESTKVDADTQARDRERALRTAQAHASRREADAAKYAKEAAELAATVEFERRRTRVAETEAEALRDRLASLRERITARPPPLEQAPVQEEDDDEAPPPPVVDESAVRRELESCRDRAAASEDARRASERRAAEARRQLGVTEARVAKLTAERDAALGEARASEARVARLTQELAVAVASKATERDAATVARVALDGRVESERLRIAEARAEAARRQVVSLDRALDAAEARHAADRAVRDADLAQLQHRLRQAHDSLQACKDDLEAKRGNKAFLFSGQLRNELRRLERANDVLRKFAVAPDKPRDDDDKETPPPPHDEHHRDADSSGREFDAAVRCEYLATTLLRASDHERHPGDAALAPVVRELIGCPHHPAAAFLEAVRTHPPLAACCRAIANLILEAREVNRVHCARAADTARADADLKFDARLAELVADTAFAHATDRQALGARAAKRLQTEQAQTAKALERVGALEVESDALRAKATADKDAADDDLKAQRAANADLQHQLDVALSEAERAQKTIVAMKDADANSAEAEHARSCVLAVLKEARVNGPTYNRFVPVRLKLVTQNNVLTGRANTPQTATLRRHQKPRRSHRHRLRRRVCRGPTSHIATLTLSPQALTTLHKQPSL